MSTQNDPHQVFVVIPAFNEQGMIHEVVRGVIECGYEVVVVDDGSEEILLPFIHHLPVHFLRHAINLGQGAALQTGIEFSLTKNAGYIVTFDADGQHQAGDIAVMKNYLDEKGLDIVFGSRFMKGASHNMTSGRKWILKTARWLNYIFTGLLLTDAHNGLRVMRGDVAARIELEENGMAHATEFLAIARKLKLKYAELPVTIKYTDYSRQKGQTLWSSFRILFDILLSKIFK